jgi:hypothetical protein
MIPKMNAFSSAVVLNAIVKDIYSPSAQVFEVMLRAKFSNEHDATALLII